MAALRGIWIPIALAVLFLIPVGPAGTPTASAPTVPTVASDGLVRIQVPSQDVATLGPGVEVVEPYVGFVLAHATPEAITRLTNQGVTVVAEDTFTLYVDGYTLDTRRPVELPSVLATPPASTGPTYSLVQFLGPVKNRWQDDVQATGAEIMGYVPNNAFLVRATAGQYASLRSLGEVQWTSPLYPAFRIAPGLLSAQGTLTVDIVTFAGESLAPIVQALDDMGTRSESRWSTGMGVLVAANYQDFGLVRARISAGQLVAIAQLNGVQYVQQHEQMQLDNQQEQFVMQSNASADNPGNPMAVRPIWNKGILGQNQIIALADTGIDYDHSMFRHSSTTVTIGDIYNTTNTARRKVIRYLPMSGYVGVDPFGGTDPEALKDEPKPGCFGGFGHGTATASAAAGNDTGIGSSLNDGMAAAAKLVELDIGTVDASCNGALSYIPDDYSLMFGAGYSVGARIFSNSWGACSNDYTLEASMVDRFMWNNPDALILFANGNQGNTCTPTATKVSSPATNKDAVAVSGAAGMTQRDSMGAALPGNTADGRWKPDITTSFATTFPGATANSDGNLQTLNSDETGFAGTSYATPLAAGFAALIRQYYFEGWYPNGVKGGPALIPSAALMKATLIAGSVQMTGTGACPGGDPYYPNRNQGWGRLWLDKSLYFSGDSERTFVVDQKTGLYTGDALEYRVRVGASTTKFKAILAWTDAPGLPGSSRALVNNLDLQVTDPLGNVYLGNVRGSCGAGQTVTGGTFDTINNVEGVIRNVPAVGEWEIRIIGANVPMGPQKFGLIVVANMDPSYGIVEIDKTAYNEADTVNIQVTDGDAAGANVPVTVTSNTEPGGETVTLARSGTSWLFRGSIQTNYGVPTAGDGKIQVSQGDTLIVTYNDVSPPHAAEARARIEFDPPVISNVRAISITNAAATIRWTTDKAADSTVYFNPTTPGPPWTTITDPTVTTDHWVNLTGLTVDTPYYYDVQSSRVGRSTRDDNLGQHYQFRTTEKAEILLIIGDATFFTTDPVRIEEYRNALASASWAWNEWSVSDQGLPTLALLQSYKVVLWQAGLEQYPEVSDGMASLLTNYVNGGGRLFVGGNDIAWDSCSGAATAHTTTTRCNFARSIMHGNFVTDPPYSTFSTEVGTAGDPISDLYRQGGTPGPVFYFAHRDGAAADEVNPLNAGGTTTIVWQTSSGDTPPYDAVKWESSANNGTAAPACVWCGARSRVASYFFEFTGINYDGTAGNAVRTDILNKTIVWLLGRSPPIVQVTYPNGGETITTSTVTVAWTRSQPLDHQELWYSSDAGASWQQLKAAIPATNTTDVVDLSSWLNGCRYLVRIVAYDTGTPQFKAQDASNAPFCVLRPGGDTLGPIVRAGSLRLFPNPPRTTGNVVINATVDDTLRGLSNISAAEVFVQATAPLPAQYGTGAAMIAVDLTFDSPVEDVQATLPVTWPSGSTQIVWVHGLDAAGNWGDFASGANRSFLVIQGVTTPPPNPPTGLQASLQGAGFTTVHLSWAYAGPAVDKFQVYFSSAYDPARAGYSLLQDNIPATQFSFDHVSAGSGDTNSYFYFVRAANAGGFAETADQAAKYTRSLAAGMQLVSMPLVPADTRLTTALQTLTWRTARTYVASDTADPWKDAYATRWGDFQTVGAGTAMWVDVASAKDFTVAGLVPASTTIALRVGWNFVGYTSFTPAVAATSFAGLGVTQLEGYLNAPQYYLVRLNLATATLSAGQGYWVYTTTGGSWTVSN